MAALVRCFTPPTMGQEEHLSEYELQRKATIEKNRAKMAELGLVSLDDAGRSLSFMCKGLNDQRDRKKEQNKQRKSRAVTAASTPRRSSGRLQGMAAVSYAEDKQLLDALDNRGRRDRGIRRLKARMEETYTVEDLNALGTCASDYDNHERRLPYEDRKGKVGRYRKDTGSEQAKSRGASCHWCRQKDTSPKTLCSRCGGGRLCGPCLQGRMGENIFELLEHGTSTMKTGSSWTCPACRGICNCSSKSCVRGQRGWGCTGPLLREAQEAGYESVAHYLILGMGFDRLIIRLSSALGKTQKPFSGEGNAPRCGRPPAPAATNAGTAIPREVWEELQDCLRAADAMNLEAKVQPRCFPRTGGAGFIAEEGGGGRGDSSSGGGVVNDGKVLFSNKGSTVEVVEHLRHLVGKARLVVSPSINLEPTLDTEAGESQEGKGESEDKVAVIETVLPPASTGGGGKEEDHVQGDLRNPWNAGNPAGSLPSEMKMNFQKRKRRDSDSDPSGTASPATAPARHGTGGKKADGGLRRSKRSRRASLSSTRSKSA